MSQSLKLVNSLISKLDDDDEKTNDNQIKFKFENNLSLENVRQLMYKFVDDRDWHQYHIPRNILLALVGEIGELSEIFQWKGEVKPGLNNWKENEKIHLGEELSDVLLYLIRLADVCKIDLTKAVIDKMNKNCKKYPVHLSKGSSKKYTAYKTGLQKQN